ncbi:hypothetical protein BV455_02967 [Parageobacillus caldoxylosilyticus]|uniref:sialidase family protein n=1 Tax=Saccharococcus caldoxylosilyticus TaxID=81408 RepID=UPI001C4DDCCA|nr:sialidase family protein [Parageobacillus caldoxylosilyticus]QXJ39601.1 hypothetical protein BV455_02967 [Parageobacillus caldoxylosilyticus]
MPTRTDVTVVNQAYDTSGNGGRKLVRLSNGWLVALVKRPNTSPYSYAYISKDNGATFPTSVALTGSVGATDCAVVNKGTMVYTLTTDSPFGKVTFVSFDATNSANKVYQDIDTGQSAVGNVSLAINSAGTELHAAWASKNSTYPNSFNIRYAKGTINADGSVTWGSVEQVTTYNTSGWDFRNPSIVVRTTNNPSILAESSTNNSIVILTKEYTTKNYNSSYVSSAWGSNAVYTGNAYSQSSPSACVAPNGRIWVAWHGADNTTGWANIRVAYSDDGGASWSPMVKLTDDTTDNNRYPTITANKNNEVFILWWDSVNEGISQIKYDGVSWGVRSLIASNGTGVKRYPSSLFDNTFSLNFSSPLFIYEEATVKVGFYGTWTVTTISVIPGYIGQKSDKSNILSYSITTDGTMSTITEKINGITIATRTNPTSGQQFTVSLTQEQWDAIKYGNAHTLTIEMNDDVWTYTFDKRLNANDDILSAVKGVQDLQDHLNAIKAQLAEAIRAKGGTVNDTDAWSAFVSAISGMQNKKWATGSITLNSGTTATISGLGFNPTYILLTNMTSSSTSGGIIEIRAEFNAVIYAWVTSSYSSQATQIDKSANLSISNGTVTWSQKNFNGTYSWIAFE